MNFRDLDATVPFCHFDQLIQRNRFDSETLLPPTLAPLTAPPFAAPSAPISVPGPTTITHSVKRPPGYSDSGCANTVVQNPYTIVAGIRPCEAQSLWTRVVPPVTPVRGNTTVSLFSITPSVALPVSFFVASSNYSQHSNMSISLSNTQRIVTPVMPTWTSTKRCVRILDDSKENVVALEYRGGKSCETLSVETWLGDSVTSYLDECYGVGDYTSLQEEYVVTVRKYSTYPYTSQYALLLADFR